MTIRRGTSLPRLLDQWPDERIKLLIPARGLRFRRDHADLMLQGVYEPLDVQGAAAGQILAFARCDVCGTLIAIVPRLICSLPLPGHSPSLGAQAWGDTRVSLPEGIAARPYRHLLTGETMQSVDGLLAVAEVFRTLPVALLWASASA